jgi:uncharacterized membrane protein YgcG
MRGRPLSRHATIGILLVASLFYGSIVVFFSHLDASEERMWRFERAHVTNMHPNHQLRESATELHATPWPPPPVPRPAPVTARPVGGPTEELQTLDVDRSRRSKPRSRPRHAHHDAPAAASGAAEFPPSQRHAASLSLLPRSSDESVTSPRFVCATLDWWPSAKCDYGRCPWRDSSMLSLNLDDPLLVSAARALSPFYLRVGGSLSDVVTYEEDDGCAPLLRPTNSTSRVKTRVSPPDSGLEVGAESGGHRRRRECMATCGDAEGGFVKDHSMRVGFSGGCLSRAKWDALAGFCERVGCELVLSINGMRGRVRSNACDGVDCRNRRPPPACCMAYTGSWDPSNAASLLAHAARSNQPLAGVAYGNELGGRLAIGAQLSPQAYVEGLRRLREVVREAWRGARRAPPVIIGPNAQLDAEWFGDLLREDPSLAIVSHHMYPLGGGSMAASEMIGKILRPTFLDKLGHAVASAQQSVENGSASTLASSVASGHAGRRERWVTEMGGAYNSGRPGVTDAFASSFWYADALGTLALHRTHVVCRQTLVGGSYALISLGARERPPSPPPPLPSPAPPPPPPAELWVTSEVPLPGGGGGPPLTDPYRSPPRGASPDFWVALLWRRLMGPRVVRVRVLLPEDKEEEDRERKAKGRGNGHGGGGGGRGGVMGGEGSATTPPSPPPRSPIRAYAACAADGAKAPPGALSLLVLNLHSAPLTVDLGWDLGGGASRGEPGGGAHPAATDEEAPWSMSMPRGRRSDARSGVRTRHEWRLNSTGLGGRVVMLNGEILRTEARGRGTGAVGDSIPELPPAIVHLPPMKRATSRRGRSGAEALAVVGGLSVNFMLFPDARWHGCVDGAGS